MAEARQASLQEIDQLHMELCSEDEGNTPMAETKFRNENLVISSLDCSPIPKSDWMKIDASNFTPLPGINNDVSACSVVHSTPLGGHRTFKNSSTTAKRSIMPKTVEEMCNDLASDISDHTLDSKHDNKNTSSQYISGFDALCKNDQNQKSHQTFLDRTVKCNTPLSKINLQALMEENATMIKKTENEKYRLKNKENVFSTPVKGRFKDVSVSRSISVLEEDILDVSEDILGLEEDVVTDNDLTDDDEMEITVLDIDTVQYAQLSKVKDKTLTYRDHLEDSVEDEMNKTSLEDTVREEETLLKQEKIYDMNMKRKSLFPRLNTELVGLTDVVELDKQAYVATCNKRGESQFSDDKNELAVGSRKRSSQTFLFTELESEKVVIGVDSCEFDQTTLLATSYKGVFDQTTLLATSYKGVFDQTTTLEKRVKTEDDQKTVQEKPQVSTSIMGDDMKDMYNALNSSIDSFDLIRSPVITKEKVHAYMLSKKDNRTAESQKKSVAGEMLTSTICTSKSEAFDSCTASTKAETSAALSSELLMKLKNKRRKRKLEKIMTSGKVLMRDIDPVEFKENKQKIETKLISEEIKKTKKNKKTKVPHESKAASNILLTAAKTMHDQDKVETNTPLEKAKERCMNNKNEEHADQKIKNRDVTHLNEGAKEQQTISSSKDFLNIDTYSSSQDAKVITVSGVVPSSAVTLQSLLVPEPNTDELSRGLDVDHGKLPSETQEAVSIKEKQVERLGILSHSDRIFVDVSIGSDKLELQKGNSQLLPKGDENEKAVGNKDAPVAKLLYNVDVCRDGNILLDQGNNVEKNVDFSIMKVSVAVNQGASSTSKMSSHADVILKDETNSEGGRKGVTTVEDKKQISTETVSLVQEHAALCQNLEGNKLIQQVQRKWKCSVKKTPETNLTTSLHAQRLPNSTKNTVSKLQGERYCTLDTGANLQSGSMVDLRKQSQQQLAKELHDLQQQQAAEIEVAVAPFEIKLSNLASAHREQRHKLQLRQDRELKNFRKQFNSDSILLHSLILQIRQEHQTQKYHLQHMMQQEISSLAKEKQHMIAQIAQRFNRKVNQLKNIAEQSQQLTSSGSSQVPYVSVELFKAPQKRRLGRVVTVCLPADVAHALLKEDAVYGHFYSGEWNE
ncbi:hypothetical protein ACJMK2_027660 [Sinanodonta woodiana]|uniref:Uncharacterized protein n=1 Tax=Sinanodonta woodiana TaxID=1069815 RepID=A0ABD3X4N0_SINWO